MRVSLSVLLFLSVCASEVHAQFDEPEGEFIFMRPSIPEGRTEMGPSLSSARRSVRRYFEHMLAYARWLEYQHTRRLRREPVDHQRERQAEIDANGAVRALERASIALTRVIARFGRPLSFRQARATAQLLWIHQTLAGPLPGRAEAARDASHQASLAIARRLIAQCADCPITVRAHFALADQAWDRSDYRTALMHYTRAGRVVRARPIVRAFAHYRRAFAYRRLGEAELARQAMRPTMVLTDTSTPRSASLQSSAARTLIHWGVLDGGSAKEIYDLVRQVERAFAAPFEAFSFAMDRVRGHSVERARGLERLWRRGRGMQEN